MIIWFNTFREKKIYPESCNAHVINRKFPSNKSFLKICHISATRGMLKANYLNQELHFPTMLKLPHWDTNIFHKIMKVPEVGSA